MLVIGCTRGVGKAVVEKLLSLNNNIILITRDVEKTKKLYKSKLNQLEIFKGDITDKSSYYDKLDNINEVYCCAASNKGYNLFGNEKITPYYVDGIGTREFIQSCYEKGVKKFLLISSICVTHRFYNSITNLLLNVVMGRVLSHKKETEDYLMKTFKDRCFFIIRPGGLKDENGGENDIIFQTGDNVPFFSMICRKDVAEVSVNTMNLLDKSLVFEIFNDSNKKRNHNFDFKEKLCKIMKIN